VNGFAEGWVGRTWNSPARNNDARLDETKQEETGASGDQKTSKPIYTSIDALASETTSIARYDQ